MKRIGMVCLALLFMAGAVFCQEMKPGMQQPCERRMMRQEPGQCMQQPCERRMMRQEPGQGMQQRRMMEPGMGQGMMQQRGMMGQGMGPMHNMVPQASMIASDNGGVIVLSGNRLLKFDKNLKLLKEVELFSGDKDKHEMPGMQPPADKK